MKTRFPWLVLAGTVVLVAWTLRPPRYPAEFDLAAASRLPTLVNGRVKPLDTVARTSLLLLQGRQRVVAADGRTISPIEWLLDVFYRPARADACRVFEIVHPEVLSLVNLAPAEGAGGKRFSLRQLQPRLAELERQARLADEVDSAVRTTFQRAAVQLRDAIVLYQHLQASGTAPGSETFLAELAQLEQNLPAAAAAVRASAAEQGHGTSPQAKTWLELSRAFTVMEQYGYLRLIPPASPATDATAWRTVGATWQATLAAGAI
ncbi:MAG: cytochrome C biogenesis protein, partial [Verrucomicrobia bacterium]|nr:cytochrome C biogenesis protein [Verrucomicrobiota bacterium]